MTENSTFKDTTINDYIPKIKEAFPELSERDIKIIVSYGWRLIYIAILMGCDILIQSKSYLFWFYIGNIGKSSLRHFNYYRLKLIRKIRFIWKRTSPEWDGYYYTGLTDEEAKLFKNKNKKKFLFENKISFRYPSACRLYYPGISYLLKYEGLLDRGFVYKSPVLKVHSPELIKILPIKSFEDILVINNEYDLI